MENTTKNPDGSVTLSASDYDRLRYLLECFLGMPEPRGKAAAAVHAERQATLESILDSLPPR